MGAIHYYRSTYFMRLSFALYCSATKVLIYFNLGKRSILNAEPQPTWLFLLKEEGVQIRAHIKQIRTATTRRIIPMEAIHEECRVLEEIWLPVGEIGMSFARVIVDDHFWR